MIDSGADLTVYSKVEKQAGCCSPDCCSSNASGGSDLHDTLHELMQRYNINDYAASVKVYAVKP